MERTTVYLTQELKTSIRNVAKREGRSEADVIREALARYVAEPQFQRPRPKSLGIAHSGRIQSDQLEEWLDKNREREW